MQPCTYDTYDRHLVSLEGTMAPALGVWPLLEMTLLLANMGLQGEADVVLLYSGQGH